MNGKFSKETRIIAGIGAFTSFCGILFTFYRIELAQDEPHKSMTGLIVVLAVFTILFFSALFFLADKFTHNDIDEVKCGIKIWAVIGAGFSVVCFFAWLFWGHWDGISSGFLSGLIIVALIIVSLAFYFLPTYIAIKRNHKNTLAILALNLLMGWTFVGWVIALVWSLKND
jgi:drug/metabolite transporter (DMT)-like permease